MFLIKTYGPKIIILIYLVATILMFSYILDILIFEIIIAFTPETTPSFIREYS